MFRQARVWNSATLLSLFMFGGASLLGACEEVKATRSAAPALATAPPLGTAESFAVLGSQTVTNTGPSTITGNLGVSPGTAVTGFPPGNVSGGEIHAADAVALAARDDLNTAYVNAAGQPCDTDLTGQDLGGKTLVPGVYCFKSSAQLTGELVLDTQGDANAVFVFQMGSSLTTATDASVSVLGGAGCNVYWQVGSSATLGVRSHFVGHILALTSITLNTAATLAGQALAHDGAVTLDSNVVVAGVCVVTTPTDGSVAPADMGATPVDASGPPADLGACPTPDAAVAPSDLAPAQDACLVPVAVDLAQPCN